MSENPKAVFLSYASQDAEAAKRICDALRGAGVEVWFDAEGGLEHGDEWDAKIRRQIKECVLFIPVISANTQAREEGYFRLEWDLAAERARSIASGVAFILPVAIDDTKETGALVPDRFCAVQWTRLAGGQVTSDVLQRFLKLWSHRTGTLKHQQAVRASLDDARPTAPEPGRRRATPLQFVLATVAFIVGAAALFFVLRPRRSPEEIAKIIADAQKVGQTAAPTKSASPPEGASSPMTAQASPDVAADKSVAVLAFANLSDDKANEYFSDGISEELLNVLAKVPRLKVAARTSSFYFKGRNEPIPEIAQKLGVAYVVEGSVRKAGNKVRVTAQLIKAADGYHVWSETYDRELTDIFAVQDEIAKKILGVVKGSVLGEAELPHATTTNIEAYTLYLQAQGALAKRGDANLREAIRLYQASLAIDPDYVPALVGMAQALELVPIYANLTGAKADEMLAAAKKAAGRALEIDPRNATAHTVIGWAMYQFEWRWSEGSAMVRHARELAPNNAWIWNSLGDYLRYIGDYRQSLATKQRAWELDPLSPVSSWDLAYTYQVFGDFDQTMRWAERAMTLAPHNLDAYTPAILISVQAGRTDQARQLLAAARRAVNENEGMQLLLEARVALAEKNREEAVRLLGRVEPLAQKGESTPAYLGYLYLLAGRSDSAARWLRLAADLRDGTFVWPELIDLEVIAADPATRPILDQPALKELRALRQHNAQAGLNKL